MFEYDICLCVSEACPFRDQCLRGQKHGPGIFTVADFYKDSYKTINDCEDYIIFREK